MTLRCCDRALSRVSLCIIIVSISYRVVSHLGLFFNFSIDLEICLLFDS